MAELLVVGFKKDMYRASEALNMLQDIDLNDAVAVYRDYEGKLRVDQSYQMTTGEGAAWGGLFGGLIGAHQAQVARAKSEIETDGASFKTSVDEFAAKFKGSRK